MIGKIKGIYRVLEYADFKDKTGHKIIKYIEKEI